ncbi:MAG: hypothetical protein KME05_08135 [Gloeocapsa sp. UFS-A4-WI-NPMV-4B04]|jgi:hypothetical protein|nr:hypothetical protein [Gloeocapsa sp. UFS-A4-WI-NPMV-4B04]
MQNIEPLNALDAPIKFEFTIVGRNNHDVSGAPYISCDDGTQLRVMPTPRDYPDKRLLWHLLPQIDSTAITSNVRVLGSSPLEVEQHDGGECVLVGNDSSSQTRSLSFFVHWLIEFWITIKSITRRDDDPSISG